MDRIKQATHVLKAYYTYKETSNTAAFVQEVCNYFDYIKNELISEPDLNFLIFLANQAGIPQYYDLLLEKFFNGHISEENVNLLTLSASFHNASLIRGDRKLHRYQKNIIDLFQPDKRNRFVLTAPTSFGKTFLVYEIILRMQYQNILLIFPTISLLSENYTKLQTRDIFKNYKIHSLSEEEYDLSDKNIFIFTPERFLSFMDAHQKIYFDFAFIDEIYKIDNSFLIDQETVGENERDIAYRLALEFICNLTDDMLLAGPYIALPANETEQTKSFYNFAQDNGFSFLHYNQFEIVSKKYITIKGKQRYYIDEIPVEIGSIRKIQKIAKILKSLSSPLENTIIYCGRKSETESYAKKLLEDQSLIESFQAKCSEINSATYEIFLEHLENTFGDDWIVLKALKGRIGIHHSLIPKYIQKEIINLFNTGALICLFSTTTITEGVNTSAKNIIITSNHKGRKPLRQFDAKNIAGRAGRFQQHYSGRVIDLNNGFENILNGAPEILVHKNYDINFPKTDIDYQITKDKYLSKGEKKEKEAIKKQIEESKIPPHVFDCFRVVGPKDKLTLYANIEKMPWWISEEIKQLSKTLAWSNARNLYKRGFQVIMDTILPIVREETLKQLISMRIGSDQLSLITILLSSYLSKGFLSMVEYYTNRAENKKTKDEAIKTVANYVYNIFKYHLVKYLGLFDVFFRYHISKIENIEMDKIPGLGLLLQKLEYNAISSFARKVSDYGVPFKLIDCYDSPVPYDKTNFDAYEKYIDQQIRRIFP